MLYLMEPSKAVQYTSCTVWELSLFKNFFKAKNRRSTAAKQNIQAQHWHTHTEAPWKWSAAQCLTCGSRILPVAAQESPHLAGRGAQYLPWAYGEDLHKKNIYKAQPTMPHRSLQIQSIYSHTYFILLLPKHLTCNYWSETWKLFTAFVSNFVLLYYLFF